MAGLLLEHVSKIYPNGLQAIRDFNLEVRDGEFLVLMGPSGCGKSTLLRMIAGLEEISFGTVFMDGRDISDADPRDRNQAMLFKNSTLYPDMTVYENMAFALRTEKISQSDMDQRIREIACMVGMEEKLAAMPDELSDEERHRALLARAVVRKPELLLLDCILVGLDQKDKSTIGNVILNLHRQLGTTVIHVTSDKSVAKKLADRIVVIQDGAIRQADTPQTLEEVPSCKFVARFMEEQPTNMFLAKVEKSGETAKLLLEDFSLPLPKERGRKLLDGGYEGASVILAVRPEDMHPVDKAGLSENTGIMEAEISDIGMDGNDVFWYFDGGEHVCLSGEKGAGIGDRIYLAIDGEKVFLFDVETEKNILD